VNPFAAYEADSWLRRRNPVAKLAAHLLLALAVTVVFDPFTPLAFLTLTAVAGAALGGIRPRALAAALTPFWLLGGSLVVSNALFVRSADSSLWSWGPFTATSEGLRVGLSLAGRGLVVAALTVLLVMTTDPTALVRSLVQQARMPARIAYPLLAAYRFLPQLGEEWETIRLAQRLRGQGQDRGPSGWWRSRRRMLVPLLASAVRRADRVAVAMDSRGFSRSGPRTQYRDVPFAAADAGLVVAAALAGAGVLLASAALGTLRIWWTGFPS
jgi:energy-coupling factor transport system permease protein